MRSVRGQVTLEVILSTGLLMLVLTGAGWVLKLEWDRARCAYLVFESAHARLTGRAGPRAVDIEIYETPEAVSSVGRCGSSQQTVRLPKLPSLATDWANP